MGVVQLLFSTLNILLLCTVVHGYLDLNVPDHKYAMNEALYESVLDEELCDEQTDYITSNEPLLLAEFIDAGIRTPRGILTGNLVDMGNFYQCLGINRQIPNSVVEGKYCMIRVPLNQNLDLPDLSELWPSFPWPELSPNTTRLSEETINSLKEYNARKSRARTLMGVTENHARITEGLQTNIVLNLAMCIPKTCTTKQAVDRMFLNVTALGLEFEEDFCRLPNDKQWVAGDYVAASIFGAIGILTIISTSYDLHRTIYQGKDPKTANKIFLACSVYTNTRRLVTLSKPAPGTLECLDGLRSLAMMWVIIGHSFGLQLSFNMANPIDAVQYMSSYGALWITNAPMTVDTFFMLSGLLLVYTTAGKFTGVRLIKNLHLFYLNRLLRMFPVLAATILLQISVFNRVTDGPDWRSLAYKTHKCRVYWWSTLLHIQNYVNTLDMCLTHTWYLAIDVQLHILSPLVLFWVLGRSKRVAWTALIVALIAVLAGSTAYNFIMKFSSSVVAPGSNEDMDRYMWGYYMNTLPRASPFFVGMIYGYLLYIYREKVLVIPKIASAVLWLCATVTIAAVMYSSHPVMQMDWDNQLVDNLVNSYVRPIWAFGVGWIVYACAQGYGGPINWALSLSMWKVLGRLSYTMYLVHVPLITLINSTAITPTYFSVHHSLFKYLGDLTLTVAVAFIVTVLIDSPCSVLIKHFMGGPKRPPVPTEKSVPTKEELPTIDSEFSSNMNGVKNNLS